MRVTSSTRSQPDFYPRSPCGERRCYSLRHSASCGHFYPRSPCGERPLRVTSSTRSHPDFYPRSPCGERPDEMFGAVAAMMISIHALLAESDRLVINHQFGGFGFLSTLSLRRATIQIADIQITFADFYPRSPCGERLSRLPIKTARLTISIHALLAESDCLACFPGIG